MYVTEVWLAVTLHIFSAQMAVRGRLTSVDDFLATSHSGTGAAALELSSYQQT